MRKAVPSGTGCSRTARDHGGGAAAAAAAGDRALLQAAEHAAAAAASAEHTLRDTGAAVLALLLLVSALLAASISLPVRRLTAATRQFASGDRATRARRGGSAEIDELAESFNTMADRIAAAEAELRAHQAELERT